MHPTIGDGRIADAEAEHGGNQRGDHGHDHVASGLRSGLDRRILRIARIAEWIERIAVVRGVRWNVRTSLRSGERIAAARIMLLILRIHIWITEEGIAIVLRRHLRCLRTVCRLTILRLRGIRSVRRLRRHRSVGAVFRRRTILRLRGSAGSRLAARRQAAGNHGAFAGSGCIIRGDFRIRGIHGRQGRGRLFAGVVHCNRFGYGGLGIVGRDIGRLRRYGLLCVVLRLHDILVVVIFSHSCSLFVSRHFTCSAIVPLELLSKSKDTRSGNFLNVC